MNTKSQEHWELLVTKPSNNEVNTYLIGETSDETRNRLQPN
jgi:hypothetical protein